MSLAGQAFLMTIALAPDSSKVARLVAATLAVVLSLLCMQLMARLRRLNIICSEWLTEIEVERFGRTLHGTEMHMALKGSSHGGPLARLKSFQVWMVGLGLFGIAGLLILILTISAPSVLL